jgi:hypothetical protein
MPQNEARSWWADVEHLREPLARKREDAELRPSSGRPRAARHLTAVTDPEAHTSPRRDDASLHAEEPSLRRSGQWTPRARPRRPASAQAGSLRRGTEAREMSAGAPRRRTVEITGRTVPAPLAPVTAGAVPARQRPRRAAHVGGPRPDRIAMWAVVLGFLLIIAAVAV